MVNRWYNPILGRFVSRDPIGFQGGMNFYAYAFNDPLNGIDPTGLSFSGILLGGSETLLGVAGYASSTIIAAGLEVGTAGISTPVAAVGLIGGWTVSGLAVGSGLATIAANFNTPNTPQINIQDATTTGVLGQTATGVNTGLSVFMDVKNIWQGSAEQKMESVGDLLDKGFNYLSGNTPTTGNASLGVGASSNGNGTCSN